MDTDEPFKCVIVPQVREMKMQSIITRWRHGPHYIVDMANPRGLRVYIDGRRIRRAKLARKIARSIFR